MVFAGVEVANVIPMGRLNGDPNGDPNGMAQSHDSSATESDDGSHERRSNGKQRAGNTMAMGSANVAADNMSGDNRNHLSAQQVGTQYKVQLVDEEGDGIDDCIKIVRRGV